MTRRLITRRTFLNTTAASAVLALTGCGGGGSSTSSTASSGTAGGSTQTGTGTSGNSYPIVDTNQAASYGNVSVLSTAPAAAGDAFYGQDAQFAGNPPAYANNGDGTVSDRVTGLMWVQARGAEVSWANAAAGAAACTVGGYGDWRLPTLKELYSLIEFSGDIVTSATDSTPYIDASAFAIVFGPGTSTTVVGSRLEDAQDWTATSYVGTTMRGSATAFGVNFIDGRIKGYPITSPATGTAQTHYVRYVRGNTHYGSNQLANNGDGTVTDAATGLVWARDDSGAGMDWQTALAWVQQQNAANRLGHNDWRLPNAKEMQSIVDYGRSPDTTQSAAIDPVFNCTGITNEGGNADYPWFWTGTTHLERNMGTEAVYVAFGRALGWMRFGTDSHYTLVDAHGAGAQRTDPKSGSAASYPLGTDGNGNAVYGRGPQGDVVRINNFVRLVRNA